MDVLIVCEVWFFSCILIPLCFYVHCEASLLSLSSFFFCFPPLLSEVCVLSGLGVWFSYILLLVHSLFISRLCFIFLYLYIVQKFGSFFHILYFADSFAQPQCSLGFSPLFICAVQSLISSCFLLSVFADCLSFCLLLFSIQYKSAPSHFHFHP